MTETAKIFINGGSQAVRLPKTCRFDGNEVLVNRIGNIVILMPKDDPWSAMMSSLSMFTDDFMKEEIEDLPVQERNDI
ncbi:MAG TPA: AbrB/MazE/SpoVT family DNA-binding domain-containing protein [Erysipelotrichaceae bacterium]|nr:AbrB/MazE/SpoVT family DNA-binding domain-containing protein [Erysipelotrichaceae bacterium]